MTVRERKEGAAKPQLYKIGVASRLCGISPHTLRKWEERHNVVNPVRTPTGGRLYDEHQVAYLSRLKTLVDAGVEISELAQRTESDLEVLAEQLIVRQSYAEPGRPTPSVYLVGRGAGQYFRQHKAFLQGLKVCGESELVTDAEFRHAPAIDLLIVEVDGVQAQTRQLIERLKLASRAAAMVVLYRFGPRWALDSVRSPDVAVMRLPVKPADLQRMVLGTWYDVIGWPQIVLGPDDRVRTATPRFSENALMRISSSSTAMRCECPNHIADLLLDITSFERYSAECEIEQPADAEEHRYLRATAASARMLFEDALTRIANSEGIPTGEKTSD